MTATKPEARDRAASRLTITSVAGSFAMAIALIATYFSFESQLALAQAADSISDVLSGAMLAWAVRTSAQPPDDDHPLGHQRAEPIAALVVAVLAGILAVEVMQNAARALLAGAEPALDWPVAIVFAAKVTFKSGILAASSAALARKPNPALAALRVDARNDVLVGAVAVIGFGIARAGVASIDAVLAIAVAIYVGLSGIRLARENIELLMGASASRERRDALGVIVRAVPGVVRTDALTATQQGVELHVYVEIAVDPDLSLRQGHEIGHEVEARLALEEDVARAVVHVGPA